MGCLTQQNVFLLVQLRGFLLGSQRIGGGACASGQAGPHRGSQQLVFFVEGVELFKLSLHGVRSNPSLCGCRPNLQAFEDRLGIGSIDHGLRCLYTCFAFVPVRYFLGQANHLHGHEVSVHAPAIGAFNRQVLYPKIQARIG
ncbi:hypothetical protein D3C79_861750 [compost metagenome]